MSDPWLTIIGIGEDGVAGLSDASQAALDAAEVIMGPPRHLAMIPNGDAPHIAWPVPFSDGIARLQKLRGQRVAVLASGDPFWFGAGSVIARHFDAGEWTALPGPSCFSLAAAEMGWAVQDTVCLGLHAAPFAQMRRHLNRGAHLIVTLRDGAAVTDLSTALTDLGFGPSIVTVMERLGAPEARLTAAPACALTGTFEHPLVAAIEVQGEGAALSVATGQDDAIFETDGQITKRPIRAITLSTLAPKANEHLWDIGGGSGSIALEWVLAHPHTTATCIEPRAERATRISQNAAALGVSHRLTVIQGAAPDALNGLPPANAIFIGGGLSREMLAAVIPLPARLVANVVTLEGEALLSEAQAEHGGTLMRIALSSATPLGPKRGWSASYPVVQWSLSR